MPELHDIYSKSWINPGPRKKPHPRTSLLIMPLFGTEKGFATVTEIIQCVDHYLLNTEYQILHITLQQIRQITFEADICPRKKILIFISWKTEIITLKERKE